MLLLAETIQVSRLGLPVMNDYFTGPPSAQEVHAPSLVLPVYFSTPTDADRPEIDLSGKGIEFPPSCIPQLDHAGELAITSLD